jgi:hypothetical protein
MRNRIHFVLCGCVAVIIGIDWPNAAKAQCPSPGTVLYVDDSAGAGGNGASWSCAYNNLTTAINAAFTAGTVQEVRVAQGTYKPSSTGDQAASFHLVNGPIATGCTIKGGYAGLGAADPDARNIATFETILSGDLGGNDPTTTDNSFTVLKGTQPDGSPALADRAVLDGVTITAGRSGGTSSNGAGVLNPSQAAPTYANCTFRANAVSDFGGGMYNAGSNTGMVITNCRFLENSARRA